MGGVMNVLGFILNAFWRSGNTRQSIFFGDTNDDMTFSSGSMPPTLLMPQLDAGAATVAAQPMWAKAQQQVDSLKQIDPDFNQIAFLDYAAKAWTQAQNAESAMDASGALAVSSARELASGWMSASESRPPKTRLPLSRMSSPLLKRF